MAAADELLTPGTVVQSPQERYTVISLVGRGGMGAVYRARRDRDGTVWALKEMRPQVVGSAEEMAENRRLFVQEAELLQGLNFPNLPAVIDLFEFQQRPTLIMEFVPGQTLEDVIHQANAPLLKSRVIGYGIQLCRVLYYLHTRNPKIIYRDLKPPNVMLTPEGLLKLLDFGVARTHKRGKSKDTVAMGSAGYAPPEQYGKEQTDERSDIYALGATLLHLATNLPPVPLQTPPAGSIRKLNPSLDTRSEEVIIRAMQLDRQRRFRDCREMEQALHACLDAPFVEPVVPALRQAPVAPTAPVAPQVPTNQPVAPPVIQPVAPQVPTNQPVATPAIPDGAACATCGRINKGGARFCAGCGKPLQAPPTPLLQIRSPYRSWEMKLDRIPFRIGRRDPRQSHYPELDLAEHDRGIASRNHALIQRDGDFYVIIDLGSTNGTFLNGQRLAPRSPQRLRQGDRIKIGEVEIDFRWN